MRTRDEHLQWCKDQAMEYWRAGDLENAVTSMLSDLSKHDELKGIAEKMGIVGIHFLMAHDREGVRRFIEGFR